MREHDVEHAHERGVGGNEAERHPDVAAKRLEQPDGDHEAKLRGHALAHEGEGGCREKDAHKRARIERKRAPARSAAQDGPALRDGAGCGHSFAYHARPAFVKCFLNMPRAM